MSRQSKSIFFVVVRQKNFQVQIEKSIYLLKRFTFYVFYKVCSNQKLSLFPQGPNKPTLQFFVQYYINSCCFRPFLAYNLQPLVGIRFSYLRLRIALKAEKYISGSTETLEHQLCYKYHFLSCDLFVCLSLMPFVHHLRNKIK